MKTQNPCFASPSVATCLNVLSNEWTFTPANQPPVTHQLNRASRAHPAELRTLLGACRALLERSSGHKDTLFNPGTAPLPTASEKFKVIPVSPRTPPGKIEAATLEPNSPFLFRTQNCCTQFLTSFPVAVSLLPQIVPAFFACTTSFHLPGELKTSPEQHGHFSSFQKVLKTFALYQRLTSIFLKITKFLKNADSLPISCSISKTHQHPSSVCEPSQYLIEQDWNQPLYLI